MIKRPGTQRVLAFCLCDGARIKACNALRAVYGRIVTVEFVGFWRTRSFWVLCHTAGLLSRAGDLAALKLMQQYCDSGDKTLSAEEIDQALADWAQPLGNQIKVHWHWRLPMPLRELISAVYFLPRETVSQSKVIMRAVGLYESGLIDSDDGKWLLRRLGLDGLG
jgi:hypothetical protein